MIKYLMRHSQQHGFYWALSLAFLLMVYDIGNLDALRQGTEGFYLQISKEMAQVDSWLTPYYRGEPHWSKPPLHFWLPFPLYEIGFFDTTTAARISILLLSILGVAGISKWVERFFFIPKVNTALFLCATIGFIKYSRIYMMEIPLSIISTLAALTLYAAIVDNKRLDWIFSCILASLAILVKGPVAWVMLGGAIVIFLILRFRYKFSLPIKSLSLWGITTLCLGGLWFLACYIKYGQYFIDYFFLRENLGKFTSKPYPIRVVFQGLIIFSLPWSLYIPSLFSKQSWKLRLNPSDRSFWPRVFILICFAIFFSLWLIPNQRSHHYAMPSLFFFLIILLDAMKCHQRRLSGLLATLPQVMAAILFFAILPVLLSSFAFPSLFEHKSHIIIMAIAIVFTFFSFVSFFKNLSLKTRALSSLLCLGFIWSFVTPLFILPTIPDRVLQKIGEREVAVVYRKPYFIEEALDRPAQVIIDQSAISSELKQVSDLLFIPERVLEQYQLADKVIILDQWRVWQKSRRLKHIVKAISEQDLVQLQERLLLVTPRR